MNEKSPLNLPKKKKNPKLKSHFHYKTRKIIDLLICHVNKIIEHVFGQVSSFITEKEKRRRKRKTNVTKFYSTNVRLFVLFFLFLM